MVTQTTNYETGDVAFAVNQSGKIVLWNQAAEKAFGYSSSEALNQQCWKLLCGNDTYGNKYCCKHCSLRKMAFRHDLVNSFKVNYKTASDVRKQFLISCLAVFDTRGTELMLHICHPEKEILEDRNNHVTIRTLAHKHAGTLTRRELEVLTLLSEGQSTLEIASGLCVSTSTVRNHVQHLLRKLDVHTRMEAIMLGKHLDLI